MTAGNGQDPGDALADAWVACMRRGDLAGAWTISDAVLAARDPARADDPALPYHQRWVWDGRPLEARHVLVRCYHGLGDTLHFVRLLAMLRPRVASITLELQSELLGLADQFAADRVIAFRPDAPAPAAAGVVAIELMELAHALRLTARDLPGRHPYLRADPAPRASDFPAGPRIGLCWAAGGWDAERSVPLARLADALPRTGTLISLQRGAAAEQALGDDAPGFVNPGERSTDIRATAALVASLDLVISVDTMIAHLAGALGQPTLLLLKHDADWRWMTGRDAQPWYPTLTRLRQTAPGDWTAPLAEVSARLGALLGDKRLRPAG